MAGMTALVLVRLFSEPIGMLSLTLSEPSLEPAELAAEIAAELGSELRERFAECAIAWTGSLPTNGLEPARTPNFVKGRERALAEGPEITVAIFSVTRPIAAKFLHQIKEEFEQNLTLKLAYPDVLYANPRTLDSDGRPSSWSVDGGITVKRRTNPKESTIEAHGLIDGQPTSRHFRLHVYDDVVTQDYLSDDQIKKTTERWELADNLGSHEGVRKWMPGTRYHFADTYGVVIDRKSLKPRIYPATEDGTLTGKPVFLSNERWDQLKNDQRSTVSAQLLLNPIAGDEATFSSLWLRPYEVIPAVLNVYIMVDPSLGNTQRSDRTAISVIGVDQGGNKYLLDGVCHRMKLSDRWDYIKQLSQEGDAAPGPKIAKIAKPTGSKL